MQIDLQEHLLSYYCSSEAGQNHRSRNSRMEGKFWNTATQPYKAIHFEASRYIPNNLHFPFDNHNVLSKTNLDLTFNGVSNYPD